MNISIQNISKSFGAKEIVSEFSLDIVSETRLCVCGPNGCGKTTFLKMLAGASFNFGLAEKASGLSAVMADASKDIEIPDTGRIIYPYGARVGYVSQELSPEVLATPLLTWVQEVLPDWNNFWQNWEEAVRAKDEGRLHQLGQVQHELEQRYGYNPEQRVRTVLSGIGFQERKLSRLMGNLSGGWRERAKLARVLTAGADFLLLDEPTNHLDIEAVEWLENFLLSYKGVLVFVAHDRIFMDKMATHILFLGGSKPVFKRGNFTDFLELQSEFEEQKEREAKRLALEIERKVDFVRRFKAKASKARQAASRQKMAKKLEKELENVQPELKNKELSFELPKPEKSDRLVLSVKDLGFVFSDGKRQFSDINFQLYRGSCIGLVGSNGCGKTTLLKVLSKRREKSEGELLYGPLTKLGYFSQDQMELLQPENTVLAEMRHMSDARCTEEELMRTLGLFLLGQSFFERQVKTLSGGEKSRLILSSLFLAKCNLLIMDEPTNHLDLESREALTEALTLFKGTILMVAHDRYLLSEVADQIWEFTPTGLIIYEGGYEEYDIKRRQKADQSQLPLVQAQDQFQPQAFSPEELKRLKREKAEQRNLLYNKYRKIQDVYISAEAELEQVLTEQTALEVDLALPEVYGNTKLSQELALKFAKVSNRSEELIEKLAELEPQMLEFERKKAELGS